MGVRMYSDIIGEKAQMYDRYRVDYNTFTSQMKFERTLLYAFTDTDSGIVACRDQSHYIVMWFNKRHDLWG